MAEGLAKVVRQMVGSIAKSLPAMADMPSSDRSAILRVELRRMAKTSEVLLERHHVAEPGHLAYVMTLSCDKVIKDALRHAPESFSDGRLARALHRLCVDFVEPELKKLQ